jgi:hypothetical protein
MQFMQAKAKTAKEKAQVKNAKLLPQSATRDIVLHVVAVAILRDMPPPHKGNSL